MNWRLPTKDELGMMYRNLHSNGVGGFADNYYWSSSEGLDNGAWLQNFFNGIQFNYNKYPTLYVRAVRAFTSDINFSVGQSSELGIIFHKDGNNYIECAFEDLKKDNKVTFTWYEAMKLFQACTPDDKPKEIPMKDKVIFESALDCLYFLRECVQGGGNQEEQIRRAKDKGFIRKDIVEEAEEGYKKYEQFKIESCGQSYGGNSLIEELYEAIQYLKAENERLKK